MCGKFSLIIINYFFTVRLVLPLMPLYLDRLKGVLNLLRREDTNGEAKVTLLSLDLPLTSPVNVEAQHGLIMCFLAV